MTNLTRRQSEIYAYLREHLDKFEHPPSLDDLCAALGMKSRGSLHKHIQGLIAAGLIEPLSRQHRGIRLTAQADERQTTEADHKLPFVGKIAAGLPLEAIEQAEWISVPESLIRRGKCYVLEVNGFSMEDAGILPGDFVVIEQTTSVNNGDTVVALIHNDEATLKIFEKTEDKILLHAANKNYDTQVYHFDEVQIQGKLIGLFRVY
jgi:repressor LexA